MYYVYILKIVSVFIPCLEKWKVEVVIDHFLHSHTHEEQMNQYFFGMDRVVWEVVCHQRHQSSSNGEKTHGRLGRAEDASKVRGNMSHILQELGLDIRRGHDSRSSLDG